MHLNKKHLKGKRARDVTEMKRFFVFLKKKENRMTMKARIEERRILGKQSTILNSI